MIRKLVLIAFLVLVGVAALILLAPLAPDGSWVNNAGEKISDALQAWWGNPLAP